MKHGMTLKKKLILIFAGLMLAMSVCVAMVSISLFNHIYKDKSNQFIADIARQATHNLDENIHKIETMTVEILTNSAIQKGLTTVNETELTDYEFMLLRKDMLDEMGIWGLYNEEMISLSVFSASGQEFTIQHDLKDEVWQEFSEEEILAAQGSALWALSSNGEHEICVARAIISLKTQKPIGYMNIVMKESYFGTIIEDISGNYSSGSFVLDQDGVIVSGNQKEMLGERLPEDYRHYSPNRYTYDDFQEIPSYIYMGKQMSNGWTLLVTVSMKEIQKAAVLFLIAAVAIMVITVGGAVAGVVVLVRKSFCPLEQLKESMKDVGHGDFSSRVKISGDDEIGQLGSCYNQMAENIEALVDKAYKLELEQRQAEIEFLKMQINPHFLYNTLDTISWMSRINHNDEVAEVAVALADFLRTNLKQDSMVTVNEELKNLRNYVFIQEYRFGDKITVEFEVDNKARNYVIPNFILQPLVENSMIHGLEPKIGKGILRIKVKLTEERLCFQIEDDGIGMSEQQIQAMYRMCEETSKRSIGIKNVYSRLKLYYGEEARLKIESEQEKGSRFSFSISLDKIARWET